MISALSCKGTTQDSWYVKAMTRDDFVQSFSSDWMQAFLRELGR